MKKFISLFLIASASIFAQDDLRNAIDEGDIATAKKMVKAGQIEEIYCGKLSVNDAVNIYEPIFKKAPEAAFEQCPMQFSYGYGPKVCAGKSVEICSEALNILNKDAVAGNMAAFDSYSKTLKAALANAAFKKPIKELVDTLLWQACNKKRADECLEKCIAYADSTGDTTKLASCKAKPEELVEKTITVSKPSPYFQAQKEALLNAYWTSPFGVAESFAKLIATNSKGFSIPDSLIPSKNYVKRWLDKHIADSTSLPGGELFRFCAAWQPFVDSLLITKEFDAKCPVFIKFIDKRDNNEYKVKTIAGNDWMVENLRFVTEYSECYDEDEGNCKAFGRLYSHAAAKKACPEGFHLATDDDWYSLTDIAGGSAKAAAKLRVNSSDDFAFSALFGGYINKNGISTTLGEGAYFWTEEEENMRGVARSMFSTDADVSRITVDPNFKLSVRCVRMHIMTAEEMAVEAAKEKTPEESVEQ